MVCYELYGIKLLADLPSNRAFQNMCLANYHSEFLWDWWNDWWAETRQTLGDFGVCVVIKPRKLAQYLGFHRISAMEIGIDGWTTEQSKKVGFNQRKIESVKCQAWRFTLSKGRIKPSKIQSQRKSWCNLVTGWDGLDFLFGSSLESHWFDHWIGQCLSSEWHFWCQSMAGFFWRKSEGIARKQLVMKSRLSNVQVGIKEQQWRETNKQTNKKRIVWT